MSTSFHCHNCSIDTYLTGSGKAVHIGVLHYSSMNCVTCRFNVLFYFLGFIKVGGYKELYYRYMAAIPNTTLANPNTTCGMPAEEAWTMLRSPSDPDMPWPAFLLGQTPASIWYWCADQVSLIRMYITNFSSVILCTLYSNFMSYILPLNPSQGRGNALALSVC